MTEPLQSKPLEIRILKQEFSNKNSEINIKNDDQPTNQAESKQMIRFDVSEIVPNLKS